GAMGERIRHMCYGGLLQDVRRLLELIYECIAYTFSFFGGWNRCQTPFPVLPVRARAFEQRVQEITPDVRPLHLEPRREPLGLGLELRLERVDADPAPIRDLADVDVDRAVVAAVIHPAVLVLRAERPVLRVVLELVQELERARETELLLE